MYVRTHKTRIEYCSSTRPADGRGLNIVGSGRVGSAAGSNIFGSGRLRVQLPNRSGFYRVASNSNTCYTRTFYFFLYVQRIYQYKSISWHLEQSMNVYEIFSLHIKWKSFFSYIIISVFLFFENEFKERC
jgi:hypothetical protein